MTTFGGEEVPMVGDVEEEIVVGEVVVTEALEEDLTL